MAQGALDVFGMFIVIEAGQVPGNAFRGDQIFIFFDVRLGSDRAEWIGATNR
jgi:hypothetical protein